MAGPKKRAQKQSGARGVYRINRGDAITADYLNRVGDAAALLVGRVRAPQRIASDEVEPQAELSQAGTGGGTELAFVQYLGDTGNGDNNTFTVLNDGVVMPCVFPPIFYDVTWTVKAVTRTIDSEQFAVYPAYNDFVFPATNYLMIANIGDQARSEGGTGVTGVPWIDLNISGRTWYETLNSPLP